MFKYCHTWRIIYTPGKKLQRLWHQRGKFAAQNGFFRTYAAVMTKPL
jgi:hypothetical protein